MLVKRSTALWWVAGALLLAALLGQREPDDGRLEQGRVVWAVAAAQADSVLRDSTSYRRIVALQETAARADARAASYKAHADALAESAAEAIAEFEFLADSVGHEYVDLVLTAHVAFQEQRSAIASLNLAYAEQVARGDSLQVALDSANAHSLRSEQALSGLLSAGRGLAAATKPSWRQRLIPKLGVGVAVGLGEDMRPHTVAGLTLGWRF